MESGNGLVVRIVASLFLVYSIHLSAEQSAPEQAPTTHVGYQVIDLEYPGDQNSGPLTVAVWYPTASPPGVFTYGGSTGGQVALDAPPRTDRGTFPLLVFSHGYGGSGLSSVYLSEALAARGWIVVCPDHHDKVSAVRIREGAVKNFSRLGLARHARELAASGPDDREDYLYRVEEIAAALRGILSSDRFGPLVDRERIAVGGHSFGGFTALGLSGTIEKYHDPRIKAVLLLSTGAGAYLFTEDELAAVKIPSMLFMGGKEADQRRGSKTMNELSAKVFDSVSSPKYFLVLKGGSHFSFNNRLADNLFAKMMSGTEEQFAVIERYSVAFLEKYVVGLPHTDPVLYGDDPQLERILKQ